MMELKDKKVVVFGIGRSGMSAALLLAKNGAKCIVTDIRTSDEVRNEIELLKNNGIEVELGGHTENTVLSSDLIVISPGVPLSIPILQNAKERNVPIIGEVELAYRFIWNAKTPIIAITGTKGKTTTTTLVSEILKKTNKNIVLAGNIGVPLTSKVDDLTKDSIIVAEISSFQLETIESFKPFISAVLNISSDHMDRYTSMQEYVEAKSRMLINQDENDFTILNFDDKYSPIVSAIAKSKLIYFSSTEKMERGVWLSGNKITTNINGREENVIDAAELFIKGPHNIENAMVAVAISYLMKVRTRDVVDVLKGFRGVEHRQEYVAEVKGVKFINNSQGTNIEAVRKSIMSYSGPIVLIMGGRSKGANFSELRDIIKEKVKALVLIGEAKDEIASSMNGSTIIYKVNSLEEAVNKAYELSKPGYYVMLSPACASFDMFKNYEDRGRKFKEAVLGLAKKV